MTTKFSQEIQKMSHNMNSEGVSFVVDGAMSSHDKLKWVSVGHFWDHSFQVR